MIDIKVLTKQRTACLHTISARCQIQSTPMIAGAKVARPLHIYKHWIIKYVLELAGEVEADVLEVYLRHL